MSSKNVTRLFTQFQPEHYELFLSPDKNTMTFTGSVTVIGRKVGRPSKRLTLHQSQLKVTKATLISMSKTVEEIPLSRINTHQSQNEVRLHSDRMLYPGQYKITLEFSGIITRPMNGLYPCYFEENGQKKILLATQFESHHAREVFPCIDEPEAKATFDLTLESPANETVLADTPIKKQTNNKDTLVTTFETTPIMSTYLLAFVIGELDYKETTTKNGVLVRTYATPQNAKFTDFALDMAVKCLDFYDDYFGIPFPLPKCDMVALPDFASGAMENWGCITYREQCLLVDPDNTSLPTKQYVAMVVAHELAHQWFGNLVTMRWWTDLWLNEGFASWIEYLAVDQVFPEWNMWTQFINDEQQPAMRLDALENTHPIEVTVRHPDEIRTIFDAISYNKGASVIHMLHEYLGAEDFREGLRHYLSTHAYANTDTIDLWSSLEKVSKKPVKKFMHAWTTQPGFPLLTAKVSENALITKQKRFVLGTYKDDAVWPIPLTANEGLEGAVLEKPKGTWEAPNAGNLKLNRGQSGFYRTVYNPEHLEALGKLVASDNLSPLDRLGILSDAFEAVKAGLSDTVSALQLLSYYAEEDSAVVWDVIAASVGSVRAVMDDEEIREAMKPYIQKLTAKQLTRLGWEPKKDESHFDSLLRPTILGMAAIAEEPSVIQEALRQFENMTKPEDIAPDIRSVIYTTAARHGNQETFDKLLALHDSTISSEERTTLAAALTGFKQPHLIQKSLDLISTDKVRLQDISYWVAYSFMNRFAKDATWEWLVANWAWLEKNIGSDMSFPRFPLYAARSFSDAKFLKNYQKFFESVMSPALDRSYKQGVEIIEWQSAWKTRDLESVKKFFKKTSLKKTANQP